MENANIRCDFHSYLKLIPALHYASCFVAQSLKISNLSKFDPQKSSLGLFPLYKSLVMLLCCIQKILLWNSKHTATCTKTIVFRLYCTLLFSSKFRCCHKSSSSFDRGTNLMICSKRCNFWAVFHVEFYIYIQHFFLSRAIELSKILNRILEWMNVILECHKYSWEFCKTCETFESDMAIYSLSL